MLSFAASKRNLWVALVLFWIVVLLVVWIRRPMPLDRHAATVLEAWENRDTGTLLRYAFPEEVAANRLSEAKIGRMIDEVVRPRLARLHRKGKPILQNNGGQGIATQVFETSAGQEVAFTADTYPVGAETLSPITDKLISVWIKSYLEATGTRFDAKSLHAAILRGLREDRARLERMGITHVMRVDPPGGRTEIVSLAELLRRYEATESAWSGPNRG